MTLFVVVARPKMQLNQKKQDKEPSAKNKEHVNVLQWKGQKQIVPCLKERIDG